MRQSKAAVGRLQISVAVSLFNRGCFLAGCQSVCLTPRKQQQWQTINYPPITLPF